MTLTTASGDDDATCRHGLSRCNAAGRAALPCFVLTHVGTRMCRPRQPSAGPIASRRGVNRPRESTARLRRATTRVNPFRARGKSHRCRSRGSFEATTSVAPHPRARARKKRRKNRGKERNSGCGPSRRDRIDRALPNRRRCRHLPTGGSTAIPNVRDQLTYLFFFPPSNRLAGYN